MANGESPDRASPARTAPALEYGRRPTRRWRMRALAVLLIVVSTLAAWQRDAIRAAWQVRVQVYHARAAQLQQIRATPAPGTAIITWKARESSEPLGLSSYAPRFPSPGPRPSPSLAALVRRSANGRAIQVVLTQDETGSLGVSVREQTARADIAAGRLPRPIGESHFDLVLPNGDWELLAPTPDPSDPAVFSLPYRRGAFTNTMGIRIGADGSATVECAGACVLLKPDGRWTNTTVIALPTDETTFVDLGARSAVWASLPWPAVDLALPVDRPAVVVGEQELAEVRPTGDVTTQLLARPIDERYDLDGITSDGRWTITYLGAAVDIRTGITIPVNKDYRKLFKKRVNRYRPERGFTLGYWSYVGGSVEPLRKWGSPDFEIPFLIDIWDPAAWRFYTIDKGPPGTPAAQRRLLRVTPLDETDLGLPDAPGGCWSMSVSPDERWIVYGYDHQRWLFIDRKGEHPPTMTQSLFSDTSLDAIRWSPDSRYFMFTCGAGAGVNARNQAADYVWMIGRPERPQRLGVLGRAECQAIFSADGQAVGWIWNRKLNVLALETALPAD